jgi:CDP-diacylglycerol--glycerol-3-phosphate 3-phosphatidyltransferase
MKKHSIPNIITSVRLVAAVLILTWCTAGGGEQYFLALFVLAGVSDFLDGIIARRMNVCTEFGARLDSVSDLTLYIATFVFLCTHATAYVGACAPYAGIGMLMQFTHVVYAYGKLKCFPSYHSTFSRASAYLIFFSIAGFWLTGAAWCLPLVALVWIACSAEGIIITTILKQPRTNVSSIRKALTFSGVAPASPLHPY